MLTGNSGKHFLLISSLPESFLKGLWHIQCGLFRAPCNTAASYRNAWRLLPPRRVGAEGRAAGWSPAPGWRGASPRHPARPATHISAAQAQVASFLLITFDT